MEKLQQNIKECLILFFGQPLHNVTLAFLLLFSKTLKRTQTFLWNSNNMEIVLYTKVCASSDGIMYVDCTLPKVPTCATIIYTYIVK